MYNTLHEIRILNAGLKSSRLKDPFIFRPSADSSTKEI